MWSMRWRQRALVVASILAVLGLGVAAGWSQLAGAHRAEQVHRADRLSQQRTLASLTGQYLDFTFLATKNAAASHRWSLQPGSRSDRQALQQIVTTSSLTSYGAVVASLVGTPLAAYPSASAIPPITDPGYTTLRADLMAGKPGLSNLMTVRGVPVVAFAVPINRHGSPAALLVVYANARTWPLQGYTAKLRIAAGTDSYVVDDTGRAVAAGNPREIGQIPAALRGHLNPTNSGIATTHTGRGDSVVSYAPATLGWAAATAQPQDAYSGGLSSSWRTNRIILVILLTLAVMLLVLFHQRRQSVLRRLADERLYDPLTGLAQRRLFDIRMHAAVARHRRNGTPLSLLYCDVDQFKSVNDRYGHNVGDQFLRGIATRLRESVREDDLAVRLGGDEFVVVLEDIDSDALRDVVSRLTRNLEAPMTVNGRTIDPHVSVGGAVLTEPNRAAELLHEADLAMYHAKSNGVRDGVIVTVGQTLHGQEPAPVPAQPSSRTSV